LLACSSANTSHAQTPDTPAAHLSYNINRLLADPNRSRVYATVTLTNSVLVIDVDTLTVASTIFAGSNPNGMTISPDGAKMFVADRGATAIGVIDLVNQKALTSLTIEAPGADIEMGLGNRLYVVPAGNSSSNGILQIDATTGATQGRVGTYNVYGGFVEISPDRKTLYYGNEGLSPSTLEKFDVSTATGTMVQESDFGQTGSNGESLRIRP
jgi:YVTN family beta-propeller protein